MLNERRATRSGACLVATLGAGPKLPPAVLTLAHAESLHSVHVVLRSEILALGSDDRISADRP